MSRARRCCCCNDVYWGDDLDGAIYQFHLSPPSVSPIIKNQLTDHDLLGAIDYRNKRVIYTRFTTRTLFYTPTEQLTNPIPIAGTQLAFGNSRNVAVDYLADRVFYGGDRDSGPAKYSFHVVGLNGAGDAEIATEDYTSTVLNFFSRTLQYDPINDKVYYARDKITDVPSNTHSLELRSMSGAGAGQATVVSLYSEASATALSLTGNFVAPSIGYSFATVRTSAAAIKLLAVPLGGGAATTLINTTATVRQLTSPQYCYKDGKIYFLSFLTQPAASSTDKRASWNRINVDGSGEETVFSFADWTNLNQYHFPGFSVALLLRLGCGLEITGSSYLGVG